MERGWKQIFAGTGRDGMEVLRGWVQMGVKRDGDGNEICGTGEISVPVQVSTSYTQTKRQGYHATSTTSLAEVIIITASALCL